MYELVLRDARLPDSDQATDIAIKDGQIVKIDTDVGAGNREIDAAGGLVAGGFVDCHVHLDKALIVDHLSPNDSGTLRESIENIHELKAEYTVEDVTRRATKAIEMHVKNGCTKLRTHVDVDTIGGLIPLRGVARAKEKCASIADVQIVAFPQEGIYQDPGTAQLLDKALQTGADIIGGMPANESSPTASKEHVDYCLKLAAEYDCPVDMHVDETDDPNAKSLEYIAASALGEQTDFDITAGHTCALAAYDESHAQRIINLLRESGIKMVTNPPTNLLLQGRHDQHPKRRGITRVDQLREADITVAAGQDCIQDGFYPYGRGSMLETALISAHAAHLQTPSERKTAWKMVTENAATVMNIDHGVETGNEATLNIFNSSIKSVTDALQAGERPSTVVHDGTVVAETTTEVTLYSAESAN